MLYTVSCVDSYIMQALKTRTREVLYEKYRTEKLLAWRATRSIDQEEIKRMLEDNFSAVVSPAVP